MLQDHHSPCLFAEPFDIATSIDDQQASQNPCHVCYNLSVIADKKMEKPLRTIRELFLVASDTYFVRDCFGKLRDVHGIAW